MCLRVGRRKLCGGVRSRRKGGSPGQGGQCQSWEDGGSPGTRTHPRPRAFFAFQDLVPLGPVDSLPPSRCWDLESGKKRVLNALPLLFVPGACRSQRRSEKRRARHYLDSTLTWAAATVSSGASPQRHGDGPWERSESPLHLPPSLPQQAR